MKNKYRMTAREAYRAAGKLCRGTYQKSLWQGNARWSGADLRGVAKEFSSRYAQSRNNLAARWNDADIPYYIAPMPDSGMHVIFWGTRCYELGSYWFRARSKTQKFYPRADRKLSAVLLAIEGAELDGNEAMARHVYLMATQAIDRAAELVDSLPPTAFDEYNKELHAILVKDSAIPLVDIPEFQSLRDYTEVVQALA